MFDLLIVGGTLVDGTGSPRRLADVAITDRRVAAIGDLRGQPAHRTIDASGRVVAPGFIDLHTHYDAQAFWDPTLSPSPLHGVTTVVGGNCGFTIAPLSDDPADGAYLTRMLARVEGIPLETLQLGVPFDWRSTSEYLDRLDGTLSVNAGFMVGHSALRRVVMGAEALERAATAAEITAMCELLADGLRAGALGFSSSWSRTHNDAEGGRVPSRVATRDEVLALCAVCRDFPGTSLEFIPHVTASFDEEILDLMAAMSVAAQRPLNWNVLPVTAGTAGDAAAKLAAGSHAARRGGRVVALTAPMTTALRLSFHSGFMLDAIPGWADVLWLPHDEKLRALADPSVRAALLAGAASADNPLPHITDWDRKEILEVFDPALRRVVGRSAAELAAEAGTTAFDALLDVVVADDLRTTFGSVVEESESDWTARARVWRDPRAVVGASDAGAHLDLFASFQYTTVLLAQGVREHGVISLEEGVAMLTSVPADLYGLVGRGRLTAGAWADIVILDPATVGAGPVHTRFDLPGGAGRLYAEATGIDRVLVGGVDIVVDGEFTAARAGHLLRGGRDTRTVALV
ncbi:amidohydrolase family protein [Frankia sp. CNm7]|uniref:Amidohydrolase family protein n=1 Tax=Frankia nepalensis TaxID=1836974 RepID=A0A937UQ38_9ACTN|nr:amidohydrolase family protein [Frankia nepalensis]MBL7500555.1 amidohydrolase family protein [Frankia nepalensis]MBL7509751.1 amidohydrolase family protein [Frankia nepalensis]MBL7518769.1 amidohydrolase family protein [Frankia nepalensis]MBL7627870.1 amidohydrolase family protein [Frankia nepalensis]